MSNLPPATEAVRPRVTTVDTQQIEQSVSPRQHLHIGNLTVTIASSSSAPSDAMSTGIEVLSEVEQAFRLHAKRWYLETLILSSYFEKILHPDYQKILTLGPEAVPLILHELEDMPNDWFWALQILTDADPVQEHQAGDMQAMADAWLQWGHDEGYI